MNLRVALGCGFFALFLSSCGGSTPTQPNNPTPIPVPTPTVNALAEFPILVAAGDIGCDPLTPHFPCKDRETATAAGKLLSQHLTGFVLPLGDLQYDNGSLSSFMTIYERSWGELAGRSRPVPGNHEFLTSRAAGYYDYFLGKRVDVGTRPQGWYAWSPAPTWTAYALNSECAGAGVGGCGAGSAQERFLTANLAANASRGKCQVAYMHHPLFSSGQNGNNPNVRPLWQALYNAGVELVLAAHDHLYERFDPKTPTGEPDATRGIRSFVVGTGGRDLYRFGTIQRNSAFRTNEHYGVLKLVLKEASYEWAFYNTSGTILDSGSGICF